MFPSPLIPLNRADGDLVPAAPAREDVAGMSAEANDRDRQGRTKRLAADPYLPAPYCPPVTPTAKESKWKSQHPISAACFAGAAPTSAAISVVET